MVNKFEERHEHFGKSSKSLLNPEHVLKGIGLEKGDTFLDVGCGEGHFSVAASAIVGNEGRIYAIDIYEEAIANLKKEIDKKNIGNIETITADITKNIALEDEIIDVCLMANILHGFVANKEVEGSLSQIARVLKAGSTLAVVDFKKINGPPGPPISIRMTPAEVEEIVTQYGFKRELIIDVGSYHYAVIFIKRFKIMSTLRSRLSSRCRSPNSPRLRSGEFANHSTACAIVL